MIRLLGVEDRRCVGCVQSDDEVGMMLLLAFDGRALLLRSGAREADVDGYDARIVSSDVTPG